MSWMDWDESRNYWISRKQKKNYQIQYSTGLPVFFLKQTQLFCLNVCVYIYIYLRVHIYICIIIYPSFPMNTLYINKCSIQYTSYYVLQAYTYPEMNTCILNRFLVGQQTYLCWTTLFGTLWGHPSEIHVCIFAVATLDPVKFLSPSPSQGSSSWQFSQYEFQKQIYSICTVCVCDKNISPNCWSCQQPSLN